MSCYAFSLSGQDRNYVITLRTKGNCNNFLRRALLPQKKKEGLLTQQQDALFYVVMLVRYIHRNSSQYAQSTDVQQKRQSKRDRGHNEVHPLLIIYALMGSSAVKTDLRASKLCQPADLDYRYFCPCICTKSYYELDSRRECNIYKIYYSNCLQEVNFGNSYYYLRPCTSQGNNTRKTA